MSLTKLVKSYTDINLCKSTHHETTLDLYLNTKYPTNKHCGHQPVQNTRWFWFWFGWILYVLLREESLVSVKNSCNLWWLYSNLSVILGNSKINDLFWFLTLYTAVSFLTGFLILHFHRLLRIAACLTHSTKKTLLLWISQNSNGKVNHSRNDCRRLSYLSDL